MAQPRAAGVERRALAQAGSGVATLGLPDSPGVPKGSTEGTLVAQYNDLASVEALLRALPAIAVHLPQLTADAPLRLLLPHLGGLSP